MDPTIIQKLIELIAPKYHEDFRRLLETGKASKEFCDYLDNDGDGKRVMEIIFRAQFDAMRELGPIVPKAESAPAKERHATKISESPARKPRRREPVTGRTLVANAFASQKDPSDHG